MQGTLYRIFNLINGKSYIGKTYVDFYQRLAEHIKNINRYIDRPLYRALNKYGIDNFSAEILGYYDEEILELKEIEYIQLYNSYGKTGYNATLGGDGRKYKDICIDKLISDYEQHQNYVIVGKLNYISEKYARDLLVNNTKLKSKVPSKYKKVYCKTLDIEFISLQETAKYLIENGYCSSITVSSVCSSLTRACTGQRKTYKKLEFVYI